MSNVHQIIALLKRSRFSLSDEKKLQEEIGDALTAAGVEFSREHRLNAKDIPDFMIGGIAVEIKIKAGAGKLAIYRQVERYCQHDDVKEIILVSNVPMGLPAVINGKPAHFVNLGKAWL
jgi:hypothetical protein